MKKIKRPLISNRAMVAAGRIELPSCGYEPQVLPLHYAAMLADLTAYIISYASESADKKLSPDIWIGLTKKHFTSLLYIAFSAKPHIIDSLTPLGRDFHLGLQSNAGGSLSAKSVLTLLGFLLKTGNND